MTPAILAILDWTDSKNEKAVTLASISTLPVPLTVGFLQGTLRRQQSQKNKFRVLDDGVMREAAALVLKTWELLLRSTLDWRGYSYLTRATPDFEIARVKNWDIAPDA